MPSPSAISVPGRLSGWLLAGGLAVVLGAAYHNTWQSPFVFDDLTAIPGNATLHSLRLAFHPPPDTTVSGRPILNLSLALNFALWGGALPSFHAVNLLILWGGALFLYGGTRRIVEQSSEGFPDSATLFAGSAALLWALHPLQTESVTYLVQRAESLMGLFYLASLYSFIRCAQAVSRGAMRAWGSMAILACWLGMGTKEVAVSLPLAALALDRICLARSWKGAWRSRRGLYLGMGAGWILLAGLVWSTHGRSGTAGFDLSFSWFQFLRTEAFAVMRYLRLCFWPTGQSIDYGSYWIDQPNLWIPSMLAVTGFLALAVIAFRRGRVGGWIGLWFFAILAPTLLIPVPRQTLAEHRMYLSLAAVILLALGMLWRLMGRWTVLAALAVAAALGLTTERRNRAYASELVVWRDAAEKVPTNAYAQNNFGFQLFQAGQAEAAERRYRAAIRLSPDYADAWNNLGALELQQNRLSESQIALERAVKLGPRGAAAHGNLAHLLQTLGQFQAAYPEIETAVQLDPNSADEFNIRGNVLMGLSRRSEAESAYRRALELSPGNAMARNGLGTALLQEGHPAEGLREFEAALQEDPKLALVRANQGEALLALGHAEEADRAYIAAEDLSPESADIRYNHGRVLYHLGRFAAASAAYDAAVRLNPNFGLAHYNLGISLYQEGKLAAALMQLKRTTELLPDYPDAHNNYGVLLLASRRPREALVEFECVKQLAPNASGLEGNLAAARRALTQ